MTAYGDKEIRDRQLHKKGWIEFIFPEKGKSNSKSITSSNKIKMPFYENPTIIEMKSSRLSTYKLIGRNSDLYSYLGADSRQFELQFSFTLPHLFHFLESFPKALPKQNRKFTFLGNDRKLNQISEPSLLDIFDEADRLGLARKNTTAEPEVISDTFEEIGPLKARQSIKNFEERFLDFRDLNSDPQGVRGAYLFFINLVRSSVIGSEEIGLGPPILRLNFGAMYKDIPCIVTKYNIEMDQDSGYDTVTLLPRRVNINLSMNEVRVGDFTYHNPKNKGVADDNIPTWESLFRAGTLDPRA